jgi:hypothetical protein
MGVWDMSKTISQEYPVTLIKEDLIRLGFDWYEGDDGMNFHMDTNTSQVEFLFLRSILTGMGYKILSEDEVRITSNIGFDDVHEFRTNLPQSVIDELYKELEA